MSRTSVSSSMAIKKLCFVMRMLDMAQNSHFSDEIDREATKM